MARYLYKSVISIPKRSDFNDEINLFPFAIFVVVFPYRNGLILTLSNSFFLQMRSFLFPYRNGLILTTNTNTLLSNSDGRFPYRNGLILTLKDAINQATLEVKDFHTETV